MPRHRHRLAPLLLALALLATGPPALPAADAQDSASEEALRLYGCLDLLAGSGAARHVAVPAPGASGRGAADGAPDCGGDRLHLEPVWLDAGASPFLAAALSPRDQSLHTNLRYLPAAWYPAPGHGADALADPSDGARGLFDVTRPGQPDYALARDDGAPQQSGGDGAPDLRARHDGDDPDADHHFPALELETRYHWHAGSDAPVPLPAGASLVFPFAGRDDPAPGLDGWTLHGAPHATHWYPRPFAMGTDDDDAGALAATGIQVAAGDVVRFLDHSIRLVSLQMVAGRPQAIVEVRYDGDRTSGVIEAQSLLTFVQPDPEAPGEPPRDATILDLGHQALNLLFAGATAAARTPTPVPGPAGSSAPGAARPSFVLLDSVQSAPDGTLSAQLTLGRLLADRAPWNLFFADGALFRVPRLDEAPGGGLQSLTLAQILPLASDHALGAAGVRVVALPERTPATLPAPLSDPHVRLRTLDVAFHTDAAGFLTDRESREREMLRNPHVGPAPPQDDPRERTARAEPFAFQWRATGTESRLAVVAAPAGGEHEHTITSSHPARYVELLLPAGRYRVDSALLNDPALPDRPVSFLYRPGDGPTLYADRTGALRLAGATRARPEDRDWLLPEPAVLPSWETPGLVRAPGDIAHERVSLALGYRPYHVWSPGAGLVHLTDDTGNRFADTADDRGNHLAAVAARNDDAALGDLYGPVLHARYRFELLTRGTFEALDAAVGPQMSLLLPVASSRQPGTAGLDTFDMDGDGRPDEVRLAGWYLPDPEDAEAWQRVTDGHDIPRGDDPRGYLLAQSRPIVVARGTAAQFFDHGVRYAAGDAGSPRILETLDQAPHDAPAVLQASDNAEPGSAACLAVRFDGAATAALPCSAVGPGAGHLWWARVLALSDSHASLQFHRLIAPSDWNPHADAGSFVAAGAAYTWLGLETATGPSGARDHFRAVTLQQTIPLGGDVHLPRGDGDLRLVGTRAGATLPLLPPYAQPHHSLHAFGVPPRTDPNGFVSRAGAAGGGLEDAITHGPTAERMRQREALELRLAALDVESVHRFAFLDATRAWEGAREGVAFLSGHFADPQAAAPALDPTPIQGFPEARVDRDERGWDHRITLAVPAGERFLVDTTRLGRPDQIATWLDRSRLDNGGVGAALLPHPIEADTNPLVARGSAWWLVGPEPAQDLYVIVPVAPPAGPTPPEPHDGPVQPHTGDADATGDDAGETTPAAGFVLAVLAAVIAAAARGRRGREAARRGRRARR